jgi:hypothetical protein
MAKFFKVIISILIVLYIASFAALFIPPVIGIQTVVSKPGIDSNLQTGTVAFGTKESLDTLSIGDTIVYNSDEKTYVYEIVDLSDAESGSITVKAYEDAEPETINVRRTATKLLFYVPFIGYIMIAVESTQGLIILGLIAAVLIVLYIITEVLCKKARAKKGELMDEDDEYEKDRKYFRDLAASQSKPNSLDVLGTLSIPPVADLMNEEQTESTSSNTIALDEEYEDPELILKSADNDLEKTAPVVIDENASENEDSESDAKASKSSTADSSTDGKTDKSNKSSAKKHEDKKENSVPSGSSDTESEEIKVSDKKQEKDFTNTSDINDIGNALEIALENERMNPTPHSAPAPAAAPVSEQTVQASTEEIELAIPARTLDELLQEAYSNGEDPKVTKDPTTGITFVDYSNCF